MFLQKIGTSVFAKYYDAIAEKLDFVSLLLRNHISVKGRIMVNK